jgi:hypothetical protein
LVYYCRYKKPIFGYVHIPSESPAAANYKKSGLMQEDVLSEIIRVGLSKRPLCPLITLFLRSLLILKKSHPDNQTNTRGYRFAAEEKLFFSINKSVVS